MATFPHANTFISELPPKSPHIQIAEGDMWIV